MTPAELLIAACDDPGSVAERLQRDGARVVRVLGQDAPYALLRAAGRSPVRLVPRPGATPDADALAGDGTFSQRGRSLLQQIVADTSGNPIVFTHADSELPQLFATVRELLRTGDIPPRPVHMLDLLHLQRTSSRTYNAHKIAELLAWLGDVDQGAFADAAREERTRPALIAPLTGHLRIAAIGAAHALPPAEWHAAVAALDIACSGDPVFVLGSPQFSTARQREFESRGLRMVGDDQDWGDPLVDGWAESPDTLAGLADPARLAPRMLVSAAERLDRVAARMTALGTTRAVFVQSQGDEATMWDAGYVERELTARGFTVERVAAAPPPKAESEAPPARRAPPARSRKSLSSIASFGEYQRDWFKALRERVAAGAPLAVVNANAPQEILRAMDVPFVVNQWWASIVAAKQQSPRYFQLLRDHGYPADAEAYSAQGIAAAFDGDADSAPWGGLPRPAFVQAPLGTDATPRIFEHWARETGAQPFLYERTADTRLDLPIDWWDSMLDRWDDLLQPERLDLLVDELETMIAQVEGATGHRFDRERFAEIMALVNEQEDYYRKTRDLIAAAHPAPVSITDTMPATMVPQWHRGTVWARDAARDFYEEVKARLDAGDAACSNERLRLMWVGRGLWSDMGFTQRWEESHGAVFVWSMYLALAADGYIRNTAPGQDPLRALAARFATMGDELRMPTWAGEWHVKEAQSHAVDGVVALSDADPFVLRALRRAGVPVLSLDLDNYNQESSDEAAINRQIADFLEGPVSEYRQLRP